MIDNATKSRLRLWLRSERAMGLSLVGPIQWRDVPEVATAHEPMHAAPAAPVRMPPVAPQETHAKIETPAVVARDIQVEDVVELTGPSLSLEERRVRLTTIDETHVRGCEKCALSQTRTRTVFGEGAADAKLMFIGEGPGFKEDQTGRPFVGPAGELLNRMIGAMGLQREQVYIANVVKCRAFMPGPPPKDRAPSPEEVAACSPYLQQQVQIIRPQVIVTLGLPASQFVLQTKSSMSRLRGTWSAWCGIKVMPTWHPSYLLRREKEGDIEPKRQAWSDLQQVMSELGLSAAKKGK